MSDLELINKINLIGQNQSPKFSFVSFDGKDKYYHRKIVIKNELEESKSTVLTEVMRGKNPFRKFGRRKLNDSIVRSKVNQFGLKSHPNFIYLKELSSDEYYNKRVLVKNIETGEEKEAYYSSICFGSNPFKSGTFKYTNSILEKIVNELGRQNNPKYSFIGIAGTYSNYTKKLSIKNADTNEIRVFTLEQLQRLSNPFDSKVPDQLELFEAQPKYEKLFKSMKITYYKNYRLNTKIIDFAFKCPFSGKLYGLEVKHDKKKSYHKQQIEDYKSISKLPQYDFAGIILSSPLGKYGISIKELKSFIMENCLDKHCC